MRMQNVCVFKNLKTEIFENALFRWTDTEENWLVATFWLDNLHHVMNDPSALVQSGPIICASERSWNWITWVDWGFEILPPFCFGNIFGWRKIILKMFDFLLLVFKKLVKATQKTRDVNCLISSANKKGS